MAQNNHRNLAGFICGFSSGKLSTVPKWYSVKRKKKITHKFKMLCLLVFLSWPCVPIKNCWRKKSCWTLLPIPPCNLGMICVTPHGNLSISEHSWWKESSNLRKSGLFSNNISNAKKRFLHGCLSSVLSSMASEPGMPSYSLAIEFQEWVSCPEEVIFWSGFVFVLKEGINRTIPVYFW